MDTLKENLSKYINSTKSILQEKVYDNIKQTFQNNKSINQSRRTQLKAKAKRTEKINKHIIIVGDFSTSLQEIDILSRYTKNKSI